MSKPDPALKEVLESIIDNVSSLRFSSAHPYDMKTLADAVKIIETVAALKDIELASTASPLGKDQGQPEASPSVVPPGYVLVPEEPTEEMHHAARDWSYEKYGKPIGSDASDGCYRAMIAAAPQASREGAPPEWQPIETAPKDGTSVVISWDGTDGTVAWFDGTLWRDGSGEWNEVNAPLLWAPLPPAPSRIGGE